MGCWIITIDQNVVFGNSPVNDHTIKHIIYLLSAIRVINENLDQCTICIKIRHGNSIFKCLVKTIIRGNIHSSSDCRLLFRPNLTSHWGTVRATDSCFETSAACFIIAKRWPWAFQFEWMTAITSQTTSCSWRLFCGWHLVVYCGIVWSFTKRCTPNRRHTILSNRLTTTIKQDALPGVLKI